MALYRQHPETPEDIAKEPSSEKDGMLFGRSGEGENHRALRLWVHDNPGTLFPKLVGCVAETEYLLPSADRIDVLISTLDERLAVEAKSRDSNEADLARGIYQCVKYRAVLRAATNDEAIAVHACLVTEVPLPLFLQEEARRLHIETKVVPADRKL